MSLWVLTADNIHILSLSFMIFVVVVACLGVRKNALKYRDARFYQATPQGRFQRGDTHRMGDTHRKSHHHEGGAKLTEPSPLELPQNPL